MAQHYAMLTSPFGAGAPPAMLPPVNAPVSLSPTHVHVGEPVMIVGPFGGTFGAEIRVKFDGAPWQTAQILGPGNATLRTPAGAKTGPCEVEINGQTRWRGECFIGGKGLSGWDFGANGFLALGALVWLLLVLEGE